MSNTGKMHRLSSLQEGGELVISVGSFGDGAVSSGAMLQESISTGSV